MAATDATARTTTGTAPDPTAAPARVPAPYAALAPGAVWARPVEDLEREWRHVQRLADVLAARHAGADVADLDANARAVLGIRAAAAWTLGHTPVAPMTRRHVSPDFDAVYGETKAGDAVLLARAPGWDYAAGVLRWLSWLTQVEDEVLYPPL